MINNLGFKKAVQRKMQLLTLLSITTKSFDNNKFVLGVFIDLIG